MLLVCVTTERNCFEQQKFREVTITLIVCLLFHEIQQELKSVGI